MRTLLFSISFFCATVFAYAQNDLLNSNDNLDLFSAQAHPTTNTTYYSGQNQATSFAFIVAINNQNNNVIWQYSLNPYSGRTRMQTFSNGDLGLLIDLDNSHDVVLIRFNPNGNSLYTKRYQMANQPEGYTMTINNQDEVFIVSITAGTGAGHNLGVVKVNGTNGNIMWQYDFDNVGSGSSDVKLTNVVSNGNDGIFVSGSLGINSSPAYAEINGAGQVVSQSKIEGFSNPYSQIEKVIRLNNNNLLFLCYDNISSTSNNDFNPLVMEFNPLTSQVVWSSKITNFMANGVIGGVHVYNNNIYLHLGSSDREDHLIVAYDSSGNVQDSWLYDEPSTSMEYSRANIFEIDNDLVFSDNIQYENRTNIFIQKLSTIDQSCTYQPFTVQTTQLTPTISGNLNLVGSNVTNVVSDASLNVSNSNFLFKTLCVGTSIESSDDNYTSIFPNPFDNQIAIYNTNKSTSIIKVVLFDLMGRQVYQWTPSANQNVSLNTELVVPGVYLLVIDQEDQAPIMQKVIKK